MLKIGIVVSSIRNNPGLRRELDIHMLIPITMLATSKEFEGSGVVSNLSSCAVQFLKREGMDHVFALTVKSNELAQQALLNAGLKFIGHHKVRGQHLYGVVLNDDLKKKYENKKY